MNVKNRHRPDGHPSLPNCPSPGVLGGVWLARLLTMGIDRYRLFIAAKQGAAVGNKSEAT